MSIETPTISGYADFTLISSGGQASVYTARQEALHRTVAIKVSHTQVEEGHREDFVWEAQALGRLGGHPSIVDVYDAGVTGDGRAFVVMRWLANGSLATLVRDQGPIAPGRVVAMVQKLAAALAAAHAQGVLHRDIKPGNVLLDYDGEPVLVDFGIAAIDATSRRSGVTPQYCPPETRATGEYTELSETYALAATAYMLLAGNPPYAAGSAGPQRPEDGPPLPIASASPAINDVLATTLTSTPMMRPSVQEFGQELASALTVEYAPTGATPVLYESTVDAVPALPTDDSAPGETPSGGVVDDLETTTLANPPQASAWRLGTVMAAVGAIVVLLTVALLVSLMRDEDPVPAAADATLVEPAAECWVYSARWSLDKGVILPGEQEATRADCDMKHSAETVARWDDLTNGEFLSDPTLFSEPSHRCKVATREWLGASKEEVDTSRFEIRMYSVHGSDGYDVRCDLVLPDGESLQPVLGSLRGVMSDGVPTRFRRCSADGEWVACNVGRPQFRVDYSVRLPFDLTKRPSDSSFMKMAKSVCTAPVDIRVVWIPSESDWRQGHRMVRCGRELADSRRPVGA